MELADFEAIDSESLVFRHPFTMIVAGSKETGKTRFVMTLLLHSDSLISPAIDRVFWYYGAKQSDVFGELKDLLGSKIKFTDGLPSEESIVASVEGAKGERTLIVLDDLMDETGKRSDVKQLFTRGRHQNISVLLITQNYTHKGKEVREMNLNSDYTVMFKNPKDETLARTLGTQMGKYKFLKDAYTKATRKQHSYLFIDSRSDTDERLRFRTEIFSRYPGVFV